jgi:integrase
VRWASRNRWHDCFGCCSSISIVAPLGRKRSEMACIRKRRGKWVVDYRDTAGIRRWVTCTARREAEAILADRLRESRQRTRPSVDPNITIGSYADRWLTLISTTVKPRTLESYRQTVRNHLLPAFGTICVRDLSKGRIKDVLAAKIGSGLSRNTVRIIHATLRAMLNAAVDDGAILANPANRLGRQLRLVTAPAARQEDIKAMTREQVARFLAAANRTVPGMHALFLLMARTGIRLGEAIALKWADVDFQAREIRVVRALSAGRLDTPKSGHGRGVDMSDQLSHTLLRLQVARKTEALKRGWSEMPAWLFCTEVGTPLDASRVRKAFARTLQAAALPAHFSPHCLRHTFASLLLQQRESPAYVQRQLGHASIQLTVDTYGKWLPMGNKPAVNRLDEPSGSKVVAKKESEVPDTMETSDSIGGPSRTRTLDPLIKSQLLYQLS